MIMASDSIKNRRKGFVFGAVAVDNNGRLMPIAVGNLHTHSHRKSQHPVFLSAITMATLNDPTQPNPDVHCAARSSKRNLLRDSIEWTQFRPLHLIKIYLPNVHSFLALHVVRFRFVNVAFIEPPFFPSHI